MFWEPRISTLEFPCKDPCTTLPSSSVPRPTITETLSILIRNGWSLGFSVGGTVPKVAVPSAVLVTSVPTVDGSVVAVGSSSVGGRSVSSGGTAVGLGGSEVDTAGGTTTIGVGEAPPQPLRRDITKVVPSPHCSNRRWLIFRS